MNWCIQSKQNINGNEPPSEPKIARFDYKSGGLCLRKHCVNKKIISNSLEVRKLYIVNNQVVAAFLPTTGLEVSA